MKWVSATVKCLTRKKALAYLYHKLFKYSSGENEEGELFNKRDQT